MRTFPARGARRPPARVPWFSRPVVWCAAGVAVLVVAFTVVTDVVTGPATVDRLTVVNPTPYTLTVEVAGADQGGWLPITTVAKQSRSVVREVSDQGDTWVFRVRGQGADGGTFARAHTDLAASDWTVEIPAEVTQRLRAAGAPPNT